MAWIDTKTVHSVGYAVSMVSRKKKRGPETGGEQTTEAKTFRGPKPERDSDTYDKQFDTYLRYAGQLTAAHRKEMDARVEEAMLNDAPITVTDMSATDDEKDSLKEYATARKNILNTQKDRLQRLYDSMAKESISESDAERAVKAMLKMERDLANVHIRIREKTPKGLGEKIVKGWRWLGEQNLSKVLPSESKIITALGRTASLRTAITAGLLVGGFGVFGGVATGAMLSSMRALGGGIGAFDLQVLLSKRQMETKAQDILKDGSNMKNLLGMKRMFETFAEKYQDRNILEESEGYSLSLIHI